MKSFAGLFIIFLIFTSCSQAPIKPAEFKGMSEVEYGESATLKWKFQNADYVKVHGMNRKFAPEDSLVVTPWESAKYNITAYNDDGDQMNLSWRVFVRNEEEEGEPKRGPEVLKPANLEPSYQYSDFLRGILRQRDDIKPDRIKIIRKIYPEYYDDKMTLRALVLDKFGNYISGYEPAPGTFFATENYCRFANESDSSKNFKEKIYNDQSPGIHLSICMENSAAAQYNKPILDYITQFAQTLREDDFLSFSYFNQDHNMAFPLTAAENAIWELKNLDLPESSGLSSFYESAFKSIVNLAGAAKMNETVLVMIAFGPENSSIAYNSNDVAESARELGIPVYIIGIGNAVENFQLKYLTSITGGKFYYLPDEESYRISDVLKEIVVGQKTYYEFEIDMADLIRKCGRIKSDITFDHKGNKANTSVDLQIKPEAQFTGYRAVAAFGYKETDIDSAFYKNIRSLARLLKDNPSYSVQLTGHSGIEGDSEMNLNLSLQRVQAVRRKLIEEGAAPHQIRVRAAGSSEPVYYFQHVAWQQYYNRRVEAEWLDPELLPYEIIAEQTWTEETALMFVENWEKRGESAYYQRYLYNNKPIYRVKIWGYETMRQAEEKVSALEDKYKIDFQIE